MPLCVIQGLQSHCTPCKLHGMTLKELLDDKELGVTAADLATRCNVSEATISRIKAGRQVPSFQLAHLLVEHTGGMVGFNDLPREKAA